MLAGAGATRFLAAFGAQVVRVEDPANEGRWDIVRGTGPNVDERTGINLGGAFNNHNVEKLGVTIDLRTNRGKDLFLRLVSISDVVTENFSAGVMERLGLGYERLREVRPDLIYVSNSGFGQTGPYRRYKTFGPIVQAICGLTFTSALPGLPPAGWGFSYMDHMGGNFMALAVLAGLVERNRSGRSHRIDMSCTDAGLALAGPELLEHTINGKPTRAPGEVNSNGDEFPRMVPHGVYASSSPDRWVAIACRHDDDWRRLADVLGGGWTSDPSLTTADGRLSRRQWIDEQLSAWTSDRDAELIEASLRRASIPVARVASPEERIERDPATDRWGLWPVVIHSEMGEVRVDGLPVHLSETDWSIRRGGPCLGEHNEYVFRELLGLTSEEVHSLASSRVI